MDEAKVLNNTETNIRDITDRKKAEEERAKLSHALNERVKELNCLYELSRLVEKPDISLEEIFRGTVNLIPPASQYPDIAYSRIIFGDKEFKTDNYKTTKWSGSADIMVYKNKAGTVEVGYLEEKPEIDEGPFLKQERSLLNALAERLGRIVESKKAEEKLEKSRDRLNVALSAADMGTWRWNIKTDQDTRDASLNHILGLEVVESTQSVKDFIQHVHPDDRIAVDKELKRAIREHDVYSIEFRIVMPDGAIRWLSDRGKIHYDQKNEPAYMTGAVINITERKKMEEEIRNLAKFPEENLNPVYRTSKDGVLLYANPASREVVLEDQTKIGDKIPEKWIGMIRNVYDSRKKQQVELEFSGKVFLFELIPVIEGGYVNSYATDITKRKKAEEKLKEYTLQLEQQKTALEHKNIAFREIIKEIEIEKNETKSNISNSINEFVIPTLKKLRLKGASRKYVKLLENNLTKITSSFGSRITEKTLKLTPREIEICNMIKGNLTSKEIANLLNISAQTVDKHRKDIRKKIGISTKKLNLTSYLQSL